MQSVLTITIKDDEKTLRFKHLVYQDYTVSADDPFIKGCIDESLKAFNGEPTDISIKISIVLL